MTSFERKLFLDVLVKVRFIKKSIAADLSG